MTDLHSALKVAPAALDLLALAEPRMSESVIAPPFSPVLIIALCVVAALATWLALPGKREIAIRRVGTAVLAAVGLIVAALLVRWTVDFGGMSAYFWLFSAVALFASVRVITHTKPVYSALYFVLTVFATGGLFVLLWAEFIAAALVLIYAGAILITYVFVIMLASEAAPAGGDAATFVSEYDAHSRDPFWAALTGFAVTGLLIFVIFDKSAALDRHEAMVSLVADSNLPDEPAWAKGIKPGAIPDEVFGKMLAGSAKTDAVHDSTPAEINLAEPSPDLGSAQELGRELLENQALNIQLAGIILTVAMVGAITLARRRVIVSVPESGHEMLTTPATPVDDNPKSIAVYGTDNPRHKAYPET